MESIEQVAKPFFANNSLVKQYKTLKEEYKIPSISDNDGICTQFSVGLDYTSPMHTDQDYMYSILTCYAKRDKDYDEKPIYRTGLLSYYLS